MAARAAGTPAVTGVHDVVVDATSVRFGSLELVAGETITIDGTRGLIYRGSSEIIKRRFALEYISKICRTIDGDPEEESLASRKVDGG